MFDDLKELYQEVILDHSKQPRNFRHPANCNHEAHGTNPLCGDSIHVYLVVDEDGIVQDAAFEGKGCAISMASASMMTEIVRGKTEAEARELFERFHDMVMGDAEAPEGEEFDRLRVLAGVKQFPMRVKCATLAWHTLSAAIKGEEEISTE